MIIEGHGCLFYSRTPVTGEEIYNSLLNVKFHLPVKDPLRYFRCNHE